ncbi:specific histone demethylase 1B [Seminavis robusta]|uniref:Specific histone demethylase 1B n=1 Tax=Seminavis robusta TaxID=568900 RepID=A0A9N8HHY4_9STRA|nr:specific histone demethylase 1B [Seminavis robusta]|eukprot:Sro666_g183990.1 specific histone demethylase 1B (408) ;mRNA; f:26191-27665
MAAQSVDVLIVGAGAAGLTAAYDLHFDTTHTYKILEASSVVGGRLKKMPPGFADFPIDIGGEWIHAEPSILDKIYADANENPTDSIKTIPYVDSYDEYVGGEWVANEFPTEDYKFVNYTWFDFINDWIAVDVKDNIEFGCQVNSIDWSNTPVELSCADGKQWTAKHVIVTASMKVLQDNDIAFSPSLPDRTKAAIDEYYFMPGLKVFMTFKERFYREAFEFASDYQNVDVFGSRYFYSVSYGQTTKDNVLGIFAVGEAADRFITMTDQELFDDILQQLDGVYDGQATPNFETGFVQNWSNEMFVKGAYTYLNDDDGALDSVHVLRESLDDKIFFAGEAVPPNNYEYGFAHEAAFSGRAAVNKITPLLSGRTPVPGKTLDETTPPSSSLALRFDWAICFGVVVLLFVS